MCIHFSLVLPHRRPVIVMTQTLNLKRVSVVWIQSKEKNKELYEICQLSLKYGMFAESILTDPSICAFHKHSYVHRMRGGDFSYEFINRYSSGFLPKLIHLRHLNWEDREKSKKLSKIFLKAVIILFDA